MIPETRGWFNTLQLGLIISAIGWSLAFYFRFVSWDVAAEQFSGMGAGFIEYRPLFDYWLTMASTTFGLIGIGSTLACFQPKAHLSFIKLLGPFHFLLGISLAVAAYRNHLTPRLHPTFIPDITFCFLVGCLIEVPLWHARRQAKALPPES